MTAWIPLLGLLSAAPFAQAADMPPAPRDTGSDAHWELGTGVSLGVGPHVLGGRTAAHFWLFSNPPSMAGIELRWRPRGPDLPSLAIHWNWLYTLLPLTSGSNTVAADVAVMFHRRMGSSSHRKTVVAPGFRGVIFAEEGGYTQGSFTVVTRIGLDLSVDKGTIHGLYLRPELGATKIYDSWSPWAVLTFEYIASWRLKKRSRPEVSASSNADPLDEDG